MKTQQAREQWLELTAELKKIVAGYNMDIQNYQMYSIRKNRTSIKRTLMHNSNQYAKYPGKNK